MIRKTYFNGIVLPGREIMELLNMAAAITLEKIHQLTGFRSCRRIDTRYSREIQYNFFICIDVKVNTLCRAYGVQ